MAHINISSIMGKVNSYARSQEGQGVMKQYINQCRADGRSTTAAGDVIITEDIMIRAAEMLIAMLRETAAQHNLPESVRAHFDSLDYSQPVPYGKLGEQYKVDVSFGDDLSRMSLLITSGARRGEHTGGGISNIVSLFDTGYDASTRVYGMWESRGEEISSLKHREGLHFMDSTINAFNRQWGALYNVYACISPDGSRFHSS